MDENNTDTIQPDDTPRETTQEPDEPDWKAKYEEMKRHSRTWEQRAKENQSAREELDQLRESEKTEAERANDRAAEVERELSEARAENLRWRIGAEFGLSKDDIDDFLHGDEDAMRRQAEKLAKRHKQATIPENPNQGRGDHRTSRVAATQWADQLLGKTTK